MTIAGIVKNGVVVLDKTMPIAEGTKVTLIVPDAASEPAAGEAPTLYGLLELAGSAKGLPPDMAEQHDHYIHGTSRR